MASRTRGVGNDPAIASVRAQPDYRQYESAAYNAAPGGRPNRVGYLGSRGFRSSGFGGYETGADGNLVPVGMGSPSDVAGTAAASASPGSGSAAGVSPMFDAPRPPGAGRSLLAQAGARAGGEALKQVMRMGSSSFKPTSYAEDPVAAEVEAGNIQAIGTDAPFKGELKGMHPTPEPTEVRGFQGPDGGGDGAAIDGTGSDIGQAGDAIDYPTFDSGGADSGIPQYQGSELPGAQYNSIGSRQVQINEMPDDASYVPNSEGAGGFYRPGGDDGARIRWEPEYRSEQGFTDQWGNEYWAGDGGHVFDASGPSFAADFGGNALDFGSSGLTEGAGFASDMGFVPGSFELGDFAGDAAGGFGDAAGGFDFGGGGLPIGAGLKLLQGDVGGAAKNMAGFMIGNAIFPGIGGAIGGMVSNLCFITEAVMAAGGQGDGSPELEVLRWFRDNVMMTSPQGQAMVQEYDMMAPVIVEAISARPDAMQIFQQIYSQFIVPSVEAIRSGNQKGALELYTQMIGWVTPFATEMMEGQPEEAAVDQMGSHAAMIAHTDDLGADVSAGMGPGNADWAVPDPTATPMVPTAAPMRASAPVMQQPMQPGAPAQPGARPPIGNVSARRYG